MKLAAVSGIHAIILSFLCRLWTNPQCQVSACGTSTHISIAHEAATFFSSPTQYKVDYRTLIQKHQDAFVAGNPYPDAMYPSLCFEGKYHQNAEDTHWAPFLNATINYIRRHYPKPWTEVADITWHSLGIDQGFLRTMGDVNFHGVFSAAHSVGDAGGDMISQFEGDDLVISKSKWYIPSKDLYNIYKEYYGKIEVPQIVIEACAELLYLEWIGEKLAGAKLFPMFAKKSPFLTEQLHDYFLGGIHDMATWTALIWNHTVKMLEHGTDACQVPRNPLYITCNKSQDGLLPNKNKLRNPGRPYPLNLHGLSRKDIKVRATSRGLQFHPSEQLVKSIKAAVKKRQKTRFENEMPSLYLQVGDPFVSGTSEYADFGRSLKVGTVPEFGESLIVGAPNYGRVGSSQHGRIKIFNLKKTIESAISENDADVTIEGPEGTSKFGWDIAVIDFNQDGLNDIAVSAPSAGAVELTYKGKVHIYFGRKEEGFLSVPDVTVFGDSKYNNFGFSLESDDVNGDGYKDLIIGSPFAPAGGQQRGRVDVIFSSKRLSTRRLISAKEADVILNGTQNYEWFGYSTEFARISGKPQLIVGAPAHRRCDNATLHDFSPKDIQEKGRVYVYDVSSRQHPKLDLILDGPGEFSKFGASLSVGDPFGEGSQQMLAVGAPSVDVKGHLIDLIPVTFTQAGMVFLFNLTSTKAVSNTDVDLKQTTIATYRGDRNYGRFGMSLEFQDLNGDSFDDLIIGSPFRTKDITDFFTGAEEGIMYVFKGGDKFPLGDVTGDCGLTSVEPCPSKKASITYEGNEERARFGTTFAASSKEKILFTSSPRSSKHAFHAGVVYSYRVD